MSYDRNEIEAVITLSPSTCYFMRTGKCSLDVVSDFYISKAPKTAANDLLYCPRLYRTMCGSNKKTEKTAPITILPCKCGHVEVITGHQRACIAAKKGLELAARVASGGPNDNCPICEGQITFEQYSGTNQFVNLTVYPDETCEDK